MRINERGDKDNRGSAGWNRAVCGDVFYHMDGDINGYYRCVFCINSPVRDGVSSYYSRDGGKINAEFK